MEHMLLLQSTFTVFTFTCSCNNDLMVATYAQAVIKSHHTECSYLKACST